MIILNSITAVKILDNNNNNRSYPPISTITQAVRDDEHNPNSEIMMMNMTLIATRATLTNSVKVSLHDDKS